MRVNQKMIDAASDTLGYDVDADRIQQAYQEQGEDNPLEAFKDRLKSLEQQLQAQGGRGVELADEIDNLRIIVATYEHQGATIAGTKNHKQYKYVSLEDIVGKTVEAVSQTAVEGAWGDEPCIVLHFSDGTETGFVLPG